MIFFYIDATYGLSAMIDGNCTLRAINITAIEFLRWRLLPNLRLFSMIRLNR